MKSQWLKNCTSEHDKNGTRQQIKAAAPVLELLTELLHDRLAASIKDMASRRNFESPAWDSKMAHYLGEQEALRSVITLLDIEDK